MGYKGPAGVSELQIPPIPWGEKKRKERGETLTLHYLCFARLAQTHAASHCVFIMRDGHETQEKETQPEGQECARCLE